jgi:aspartyl-tRNA(Asn)/glutamyl-tRNA(Gln) amidotransferase subunit A
VPHRHWNGAPIDPAFEKWDDLAMPLKGLRIAYSPTFGYAKVQPEVQASVEAAVQVFKKLGASIDLVEKPFKDPTPAMKVLFATGIAHSVRKLSNTQRNLIDPGVQPMIAFGESVDRTAFMEASEVSMTLAREMRLFHEQYPLLLSPTVAVAPFAVGTLSPEGYDPEDWLSWSPFTYPFNMTGQPAMSVPCGLTSGGLPIGLQLVGAHYAEKLLLRAAYAFEQANPTPVGFPPTDLFHQSNTFTSPEIT